MQNLTFTVKNGRKLYELSDELCQKMLEKGEQALDQCYPKPGEGFAVAVLTSQGNIYTGASYQSATQTLTMHSEAVERMPPNIQRLK